MHCNARTLWEAELVFADVAGLICGVTGLMSLVKQHWHDKGVYTLTLVYVSVLGFIVFLVPCLFSILQGGWDSTTYCVALEYCVGVAFTTFALLAALYADWALGMMTDNLVGLPTSDNSVLYWCYFAAKRLPMASW
ncbi:hypothetical protein AX16_004503 [Volvariella volvacea WC 439]|nr:hypothetical protein AX16_004503 [Volvariella volvacea WC 439]